MRLMLVWEPHFENKRSKLMIAISFSLPVTGLEKGIQYSSDQ